MSAPETSSCGSPTRVSTARTLLRRASRGTRGTRECLARHLCDCPAGMGNSVMAACCIGPGGTASSLRECIGAVAPLTASPGRRRPVQSLIVVVGVVIGSNHPEHDRIREYPHPIDPGRAQPYRRGASDRVLDMQVWESIGHANCGPPRKCAGRKPSGDARPLHNWNVPCDGGKLLPSDGRRVSKARMALIRCPEDARAGFGSARTRTPRSASRGFACATSGHRPHENCSDPLRRCSGAAPPPPGRRRPG